MFKNNIDRHKFQHSNVMDLSLKRKLSMLTLNLQIKFRNAHRPKILTVNILLQIRACFREEKLEIVKIFAPKST